MLPRRVLLLLLCALLAGCGSDETSGGDAAPVAPAAVSGEATQHVHGLAVDPDDGALLIATHAGLFRAGEGQARAQRVSRDASDFMGFTITPQGGYVASGHPALDQQEPPMLGFLASSDKGRTWRPVSLRGEADFHALRVAGTRVYGALAGSAVILASGDEGATWGERRAPAEVLDLAVHPRRPDELVVTTEAGLARSTDAGGGWRYQSADVRGLLAWPEPDRLLAVDGAGRLHVSADAGRSFREVGDVGGQPTALHVDGDVAYVALADGTVRQSADGGRSWRPRATI